MQIDEEIDDDDYFEDFEDRSYLKSIPKRPSLDSELDFDIKTNYLTAEEFMYSMDLIDKKINSLYKLCRFIGEQQRENSKLLRKLVAVDELSPDFWNVSNFDTFSNFIILFLILR